MRVTMAQLAQGRRTAPRPRLEREIQRAILDFLRTVPGVVAWKTGGGLLPLADGRRVRMGHKGVSDIVGWVEWCSVREGRARGCTGSARYHVARFLAIEVKQLGALPTDEQRAFLNAVTIARGIAIVATCVDDVIQALGLTPARRAGR